MTFTFRGTKAALVEKIRYEAAAENRDIYIDDRFPDKLEIGFERLGHSGGRFFYADITEAHGILTLTGEAEDSDLHKMSSAQRLRHAIRVWAGGFLLLAFCGLILWIAADDLGISPIPFWAALLIPTIYLLSRIPLTRREQQQRDQDFYAFLARILL